MLQRLIGWRRRRLLGALKGGVGSDSDNEEEEEGDSDSDGEDERYTSHILHRTLRKLAETMYVILGDCTIS
jgi:hypothetical protein